MLKGNKGEWSEFYTFIKLINDREIAGADENLNKVDDVVYPILKIIRDESGRVLHYELEKPGEVKILHFDGNSRVVELPDLKSKVVEIFNAIKNNSKTIPVASDLIKKLEINTLNAGNDKKEDLVLKIHDFNLGKDHEAGFSIKSKLGSPATLLNASTATNFTFKISGLKESEVEGINAIETGSKLKDRISKIYSSGGLLHFHEVESKTFEANMRKIDTVLPEIMAKVVLAYYSNLGKKLTELLGSLNEDEIKIAHFDLTIADYEYKIKSLLKNVALGMVPASPWDGSIKAHGGVIIVREDGELVCYHLYNADEFRNYLFRNTRLDSSGSRKHKYGKIYIENAEMYIKLNLQIRFNG